VIPATVIIVVDSPQIFLKILLIAGCVGSGMMAGLFASFSSFVMKALASLSSRSGIEAMQAINRLIVRPSFLIVFVGTGVLGIVAVVLSWRQVDGYAFQVVATSLYLLACIVSTILFNVPLNDKLAEIDANSEKGALFWQHYLVTWTRWNHVRAIATFVASILFACALTSLA